MKVLLLLLCLLALCIAIVACVFTAVCICARMPRRAEKTDCLIVLGAKLNPDGSVKPTLKLRCDAAYDAWKQGMAGWIIVCGGQMAGEPRPHSEAMRDYLLSRGVPRESILVENQSQNTVQNLENAGAIMEEYGFRRAALVTSDYHITRALWIARAQGLRAGAVPAKTPGNLSAFLRTRKRETVSWFLYFMHRINKENKK